MKKTLIITLILSIGFSFQHCVKCKCSSPLTPFFDIVGIDLTQYHVDWNPIVENDSLSLEEYQRLEFRYIVDYIAKANAPCKKGFSLMNTALACSCPTDGFKGSKNEYLENINFVTLNDFDSLHLANTSINDYWTTSTNQGYINANEFILQDTSIISFIDRAFLLTKAPELNSTFQFRIDVDLSTGESYSVESDAFILTP